MESFEQITGTMARALGVSWASGINLYAAMLALGVGSSMGYVALPQELQILANPLVIGAAGLMYFVEFFADKIPGVDTGWDAIHTFIRIPAGSLLAFGAVGDVSEPIAVAAAVIGGGMAAATHATKAGSRVMINTSPEPFTNWAVSIGEDVAVLSGLWVALNHPVVFLVLLAVFILFIIWFLPRLWSGIKKVFGFIGRFFGAGKTDETEAPTTPGMEAGQSGAVPNEGSSGLEEKMEQLNNLLQKGLITEEEYSRKKGELLDQL